ncbi:MarR family winged helix-turn-helix transcriptional regulator [Yinghuangia seranimata]|uniref:MarR family winged helix-turn-helix transcriptional regulator n=1 Tax=Yinghuangia seranimata TaxID=408067 RepID=UPI00248B38A1|nr:MarR family transcriptional regulator [Yinghuangia seranimata]MDI2129802.1 MarR family transcriptional regulator [Yinghuangia seranimata]
MALKAEDMGSLSFMVRRTWLSMRSAISVELKEYGLTSPQYATLLIVAGNPGCSNSDIARKVASTRQAANEMLTALEGRGLLTRAPNPADRRTQQLHITDAGSAVLAGAHAAVQRREAELETGFTDEERAVVRRWCETIGDKCEPGEGGWPGLGV